MLLRPLMLPTGRSWTYEVYLQHIGIRSHLCNCLRTKAQTYQHIHMDTMLTETHTHTPSVYMHMCTCAQMHILVYACGGHVQKQIVSPNAHTQFIYVYVYNCPCLYAYKSYLFTECVKRCMNTCESLPAATGYGGTWGNLRAMALLRAIDPQFTIIFISYTLW